ncbi:hypothetical protein KI688_008598 [Linnemannia hyalina]|uniref:Uncharacterized protein n=1 Tax=Linnemannia hyalina TaxID=64524 RepID=A0A9P7Y148_9FUNG|nr:hypothetical protein KI688_008598 [Linnemannia hyalina]
MHSFMPDWKFVNEAAEQILHEGFNGDLYQRLGGAFIASEAQPIAQGQASVAFRFINKHHLALNFSTTPSLARLIIAILDGSWTPERGERNETGFLVLWRNQENTITYPIPPSSFLLRYISALLHINIFLFDTAARPIVITHPYPKGVVGILHDASSILGYSDYNVLGPTRTEQDDLFIDLRPPTPPSLPLPPGPAATFRTAKRPRQQREGCEIDRVALETIYKEECEARVKKEAADQCRTAKKRAKKEADPREALEKAHIDAKQAEEKRVRTPRGVMNETARRVRQHCGINDEEDFTNHHASMMITHPIGEPQTVTGRALATYKAALSRHFDMAWIEEQDHISDPTVASANSTTIAPTPSDIDAQDDNSIRTITLPLTKLLRTDLPTKDQDYITKRLNDVQGEVSDFMESVAMGADDYFKENPIVEAGVITPEWKQIVSDATELKPRVKDPATLLSQDYLQYLGVRIPELRRARKTPKTTTHPLWDTVLESIYSGKLVPQAWDDSRHPDSPSSNPFKIIPSLSQASGSGAVDDAYAAADANVEVGYQSEDSSKESLGGLTATLMREYATNIKMIWSGDIYERLRRYVVHNVLRLNLRPQSEEKHRIQKRKRAIKKAEEMKEASASASQKRRESLRNWKRRNQDLFNQLDHAFDTSRDEERINKIFGLIDIHQERRPGVKEQNKSRGLTQSDDYETDSEFDGSDDSDDDMDTELVVSGSSKSSDDVLMPCTHTADQDCEMGVMEEQSDAGRSINAEAQSSGPSESVARSSTGPKEPTSKKLRGLEAVAIRLLELPDSNIPITEETVKAKLYEPEMYSTEEILAVLRLVTLLRPFTPKKAHSGPQSTSYPKSVLTLGPFVMTYVDFYTVRITGRRAITGPNRHFTNSAYEDKKKKHVKPSGVINWTSELLETGHTPQSAAKASEEIKIVQDRLVTELQPLKKGLKAATTVRREKDRTLRHYEGHDQRHKKGIYQNLQEARKVVNNLKKKIVPLEAEIREKKQQRYYYNRLSKATAPPTALSEDPSPLPITTVTESVPTVQHPGMQDFVQTTSIKQLLLEIEDKDRQLPVPGTDRGLVTMSETVPSLWSTLESLSNRYYILHGHPDTHHTGNDDGASEPPTSHADAVDMDIDGTDTQPSLHSESKASSLPERTRNAITITGSLSRKATIEDMRFAKSNRITAKQVKEVGGVGRATRTRERLLRQPENQRISELHKEIGENSVLKAQTISEVDSAQVTRRSATQPLRNFEGSKSLVKQTHHKDLQLQRAWQTIAADERRKMQDFSRGTGQTQPASVNTVDSIDGCCKCGRHHLPIRVGRALTYPQECPRDALPIIPIMFVGTAGIGTGSRIGGHLKYGGKKVVEQHALSVPVLMTDENMTSKVCPFCFAILRLVKELRLVNGVEKLVTINGAVQCENPNCESVRAGYARRGRDSNACVNIALAGFTTIMSDNRQPLPPYRRSTRPEGATPSEPQSLATGTQQNIEHFDNGPIDNNGFPRRC